MSDSDNISCIFFVPAFPAFKEPKVRAMLAAIESTLPTKPLAYRIAPTGNIQVVDDPGAWCTDHLAGETPEVICNGNEHELVSLDASHIAPAHVSGGGALVQMSIRLPSKSAFIEKVPDLVGAFGPGAGAYWGGATHVGVGAAVARGAGRKSPDPGFPRPMSPSVAIPGGLEWVSYWSDEACRLLGFSPDDARVSLFARVAPANGHGLVLQLTEEPLDLDQPEHLAALTAVYEAFPAIDEKWGL